jgi:hypothetical protein
VPVPRLSFPSAWWRRPVAILGAYAIALQLVLSGVMAKSPATWGSGRPGATCFSSSVAVNDITSHPGDDSPICSYCSLGCAMTGWAATGDPSRMTMWRPAPVAVHRLRPMLFYGSRRLAAGPHYPRAPPA